MARTPGAGAGGRADGSLPLPCALFSCSRRHSNSKAAAAGGDRAAPVPCRSVVPGWHGKGPRRKPGRRKTPPREPPRSRSGVRASGSDRFQNASEAPPPGASPPPALICMARLLPRCHWPAPRPAHCPSTAAGFRAPSHPEVQAAGGLLNRGGGGGGGGWGRSGARSADESAAPRVGEAGGQLETTSAAPTTAGPKVRRRRAARAPQQASGRRRSGGPRGLGLPCGGLRQRGEESAPETAAGICGPGGRPAAPSPLESSGRGDSGSRHRVAL